MQKEFVWTDNLVKEYLRLVTSFEENEYWQQEINKFKASKQKPSDYEIMSFCKIKNYADGTSMNFIYIKTGDKFHFGIPGEGFSEQEMLNNNDFKIESVKRLSDGEVFSIGDEVKEGKIIGFDVRHHTIYVKTDKYIGTYHLLEIKKAEPKKQPILVTTDGIEIFEGDCVFTVGENLSHTDNVKYFSTQAAANDYIMRNKPCLSVNDVMDKMNERDSYDPIPSFTEFLIDLVKSKIN